MKIKTKLRAGASVIGITDPGTGGGTDSPPPPPPPTGGTRSRCC